jgi:hypothetical protein
MDLLGRRASDAAGRLQTRAVAETLGWETTVKGGARGAGAVGYLGRVGVTSYVASRWIAA